MLSSTFRRLMLGALLTAGGTLGVLAFDQAAAHAADKPPTAEVVLPDEAADQAQDVVEVVKPEDPPPPCDEPAAEPEPAPKPEDEPKPEKPADEPKPRDDKPETPAEPEPEPEVPADEPASEPPVDDKPKPHKPDPIVELPPVDVPPVPDPVVVVPAPVVIDVPPAPAPTLPPAPAPVVTPEPSTPAPKPDKPEPPAVEAPEPPPVTTPVTPTPAPAPLPAPAVPLPVTIGPVPATGITLDGTPSLAVDDVPATAAVLETPLCDDTQPEPARDYPRGNIRRILDTTTGLTVTTVPADPPAKPCPTKPVGPDATPAPTVKPPSSNAADLLATARDGALHHPVPALLRHIWPRAWIPATRAEHIEPRPA